MIVIDRTVDDETAYDVDDDAEEFFEDWSFEDESFMMTEEEAEQYLIDNGIDTSEWYDRLRDTILEKTGVWLPMAPTRQPKGKA